jgi:hypothetical protein
MPRLEKPTEEVTPPTQTMEAPTHTMEVDAVQTTTARETPNGNDQPWQVVNDKGTTRNTNTTFEQNSKQYLPVNLPEDKQINNTTQIQTKFILPLTIRINKKWKAKATVHKPRAVVAILQAMQNVFPDTYLATVEEDKSIPAIINIKDVPMDEHQIKQYLATPLSPKQNFQCKVYMMTNHTIQEYKGNTEFFEYIKKENIIMEINDLDDINPSQVGFLEHVLPRYDTLEMHTNRLKKLLPPVHPKFQLHIQSLFAKTGEKTRIIMIKTDDKNVDELRRQLNQLQKMNKILFFPMNEYQSCLPGQKVAIVKRINTWSGAFRSLLITGFTDNEDDIPMVFNEEAYPDEPLTKIGVTEFLATRIKAGDGKNLFCTVYPPYEGTREVICEVHQFAQAYSYVKVALGELTRQMDEESMLLVFQDPDSALIQACASEEWEPHFRATTIENMPYKEKEKYQTKRTRKEVQESNPSENQTKPTAWTTLPPSITINKNIEQPPISTMTATNNNGSSGLSVSEFENYKKEMDERLKGLQSTINSTTQSTNKNTETLAQMDDRIKNISKAVVNVDDRLLKVENAINYNTSNTDTKFNQMMSALAELGGKMEQSNQTVAYLLSLREPNGNSNTQDKNIDQMMSEQHATINNISSNGYTNNSGKEDYQSGQMMAQTYHS